LEARTQESEHDDGSTTNIRYTERAVKKKLLRHRSLLKGLLKYSLSKSYRLVKIEIRAFQKS
jgi:hypothetical protein